MHAASPGIQADRIFQRLTPSPRIDRLNLIRGSGLRVVAQAAHESATSGSFGGRLPVTAMFGAAVCGRDDFAIPSTAAHCREGEVANGHFGAFQFAESGFR